MSARKRTSGLTKRKDGRYVFRYLENGTKKGRFKQETLPAGTSFEKAKAIYRLRLEQAARRKGRAEVARLTFGALAGQYLEIHGPEMAKGSLVKASAVLKLRFLPLLNDRAVEDLKKLDVLKYQADRKKDGAKPSTINREVTILRAILNFGEDSELIERNPLTKKALRALESNAMRTAFFEPDEWRRFVAAFEDPAVWQKHIATVRKLGPVIGFADRAERRYGGGRKPDSEASAQYLARLAATVPVMRMLLFTGSRLGEITGLRWESVDRQRELLSIYQEKTRRIKTVPITPIIGEILAAQPQGIGKAFIFVRPDGSPVAKVEVQRAFYLAVKLAGIKKSDLVPHSIRHTAATWLAIEGFSERQRAELLGHSQRSTTDRYSHLSPGHMRPVLEALERIEKEGFKTNEPQSGYAQGYAQGTEANPK